MARTTNWIGLTRRAGSALLAGLALAGGLSACSGKPELDSPRAVTAPYDTSKGELLWVVLPLRNESGVSREIDVDRITGKLIAAAEEIQGVRAVPLTRTLEAMRLANIQAVRSPQDARRLAQVLNADGVVVGSVKSWDPYTPSMSIALALYARPGAMASDEGLKITDPRALTGAATIAPPSATAFGDAPVATTSENLDAKNHAVLMELRDYAQGRTPRDSALGWKRYTASMPLYEEFAAYVGMDRLMRSEWVRVAGKQVAEERAKAEERQASMGADLHEVK